MNKPASCGLKHNNPRAMPAANCRSSCTARHDAATNRSERAVFWPALTARNNG